MRGCSSVRSVVRDSGDTQVEPEPPTLLRQALDKMPDRMKLLGVPLSFLGAGVGLVYGARDLWNLEGPGWAKVLAWYCVAALVIAALGTAALQSQHRSRQAKLHRYYQELLDQRRRHTRVHSTERQDTSDFA